MDNQKGIWGDRLKSADEYYNKWATRYKCKQLEEYYRGFQWQGDEASTAYVLNMVMATVEIKLASYTFQNVSFKVKPRPNKSDTNFEFAVQSAQLKEDCLNTLVSTPNSFFNDEIEAALKDSFFRFGIIETGYSADWITNPNAGKPLYEDSVDGSEVSENPIIVRQPDLIPQAESIYFKRINPARFRVGGIEGRYLRDCNWFSYYDFYDANDLKSSPVIKDADQIQTVSHRSPEWDFSSEFDELLKKGDLLKIWKIWDNRAKKVMLYDPSNDVILWENAFKRIPIFDLRWARDIQGWYPIPPVFNWLSPQNEINESREQMKSYRKRFTSQQFAIEGLVDEEELSKYEEAKDGAIIKIKKEGAIGPIQKDSLTNVVPQAMIVGKDDMVLMSGTSSESMGQADRITATQSIEISKRFAVREAREQFKVANWVINIAKEALLTAMEKFIAGLWIKSSQNAGESILGSIQVDSQLWQYIMAEKLDDGVDFDVDVQITSMSPIDNDTEKRKFLEFLAVLTQFPQIALSPMLIREAAYRIGYRNEQVIRELQATSLLTSLGAMSGSQLTNQGQTGGANTAQGMVESQSPNDMAQIQSQMEQQIQ